MTPFTPLTVRQLITPLAFCHQTPIPLHYGFKPAVAALRQLGSEYAVTTPYNNLNQQPKIALIISALLSADLLTVCNNHLIPSPTAIRWLDDPNFSQLSSCIQGNRWLHSLKLLRLDLREPDRQWLIQQITQLSVIAQWIQIESVELSRWRIVLPPILAPRVEFELYQFSHYHRVHHRLLTPSSLALALTNGYDVPTVAYSRFRIICTFDIPLLMIFLVFGRPN
jgi:hypothetical protein